MEIKVPPIPDAFPELLRPLTEKQLARLAQDDAAGGAMVASIGSVASMASLLDRLRATNLREATGTLRREAELSRLHTEVTELQQMLRDGAARHRARVDELSKRHSATPAACLQQLQSRSDEAKKASDGLANALLHRASTANDAKEMLALLAKYQSSRMQYHTLAATEKALSPQPPRR